MVPPLPEGEDRGEGEGISREPGAFEPLPVHGPNSCLRSHRTGRRACACFWAVLFAGLLISFTGCSSFSSADRNPAFADPAAVNGEITASEEASLKQVMQAAQISMKELGIEDVAVESDDQSAKLAGRAPTGQRVFVTLRKHGQRTTKLSIVVVPGDEVGPGRLLLAKIENRLLTSW